MDAAKPKYCVAPTECLGSIHSPTGGPTYELKYDAASVLARLENGNPIQLIVAADLNEIETKQLINEVAAQLKVKASDVKADIKSARNQQRTERARERDERRLAARSDPRPQLTAPYENAPWIPQMENVNEALGKTAQPPTRDVDGNSMQVRERSGHGLHAFSSANEDEDV